MIMRSASLERRLARETLRHAGSLARFAYFDGEMPASCELPAQGERLFSEASEEEVRRLADGIEPMLPTDATYWRLLDNGGLVVAQGDGK
jgi:hypothetical protein